MKRSALQTKTPLLRKTPLARSSSLSRNIAPKAPRQRKCAVKTCRQPLTPRNMAHKACSPECALALVEADKARAQQEQAKAANRERKAARDKLKTRSDWAREAQAAVNSYVRERDADLPCISCGRHHQGKYHAGHYLARGSHPHLALNPLNIAKQCAPCNTYLSGNQARFRQGLVARIGREAVEALEADNTPRKHSIDDLKAIRDEFRAKLRALKKQRQSSA